MTNIDFQQEKILIHGTGGSGKSFSIPTLFKLKKYNSNMRVVYLMTERNAMSGLVRGLKHHKIELEEGDLVTCLVKDNKAKAAFKNQANAVKEFMSKTASEAQIVDSKSTGGKEKYSFFLDVCNGLDNFKGKDFVTGNEVVLGSVGDFDINDILIIDGLTPIVLAIWNAVKGDRVVNIINDYQTVQHQLKQITFNLTNLDCSVILLAHTDRITDDLEKVEKLRIALGAGNALAGSYAGFWADVIYAYQKSSGDRVWATKKAGVEAIGRNLPEADNLLADFSLYDMFIPQEEREDG